MYRIIQKPTASDYRLSTFESYEFIKGYLDSKCKGKNI
jgi:hypothetical protein